MAYKFLLHPLGAPVSSSQDRFAWRMVAELIALRIDERRFRPGLWNLI